MLLFGFDAGYLLVGLFWLVLLVGSVMTAVGIMLIRHFEKTGVALFPKMFMLILNVLETPIKNLFWLFRIETKNLFIIRSELINLIYRKRFAAVPFTERAIFLPQCLRSQKCPANTDEEGLHCKGCGLCEIAKFKKEAEEKGYKFFIAPGGTMVKRMIKKYKPKGIIGVGCENEIQMGAEMAIRNDIIPQTIPLLKSGCVETIVDWDEVRRVMNLSLENVNE